VMIVGYAKSHCHHFFFLRTAIIVSSLALRPGRGLSLTG
jgi:hypothetical protein